jgi:3-hydroxyisobutyrate dehydrogenase
MIALLGTGTMGAPMARNMHDAGLAVRAWNRSPERARPLAAKGIELARTAADAVHGAEIVVTMLADGEAVTAALEDGGAIAAMADGALLVQASTVGIAATEAIAALCEDHGVALVDAPVLGTKAPAEQGELVVLASGPQDAQARCEPLFDAIGSRTVWLGEAGAGTRMKLVLNSWLLALTAALGESIAFAEGLDLDPTSFLDIIRGGPLGVPYADLKGKAMIERSYEPSFALALAAKDAGLLGEAAARHDVELVVGAAVEQRFRTAQRAGLGEQDMAAVAEPGRA